MKCDARAGAGYFMENSTCFAGWRGIVLQNGSVFSAFRLRRCVLYSVSIISLIV